MTPLLALASRINSQYTFEWLQWISRVTLRILMVLSLAAMALPEVGFNSDEALRSSASHDSRELPNVPIR